MGQDNRFRRCVTTDEAQMIGIGGGHFTMDIIAKKILM
jgi:hypothetical protein